MNNQNYTSKRQDVISNEFLVANSSTWGDYQNSQIQ